MATETSRAMPLTCHGHSRPITHLGFSDVVDDNQFYLISACKDNNPMLRDGATGDWIGTFLGHKGACWQGRLSSDGNLAASASADFTAKVWDTTSGECLHTFQHSHIVRSVALPHRTRPQQLATGSFDKKLMLYDINVPSDTAQSTPATTNGNSATSSSLTGSEISPGAHGGAIKSLLWAQDPNVLITACEDKHIRWFDLRTRSPITSVKLDGVIGSCELTSSLSTLCVAAGNTAHFFSGTTPGQLVQSISHPADIASVALHEGQRKYVTGGNQDTWIRLWDLDSSESAAATAGTGSGTSTKSARELSTWKGHHGPVWTLAFSPDGKLCASGSEDGTVKLWKFCEGPYGLWR